RRLFLTPWRMSVTARVLVIDDEPHFLRAATNALAGAGYDVVSASDYMSALEQVSGEPKVDLLVTDIVMPSGMNGFALARMAKVRQRDLKVLYMTAFDVPTDEAIGKVLRKPIDADQLVAEVKAALAG